MKKLSLLFVFALFTLVSTTSFAQEVKEANAKTKTIQQKKVEVKIGELPSAVTKTLAEKYSDYTAAKAYKKTVNKKKIYCIDLVKEDESLTVNIDSEGTVIKKKNKF